ncbi:MAG: heavy-metal-associated domain-containing protein [Armatimonadota bacterium]
MTTIEYQVQGMSCNGCAQSVERRLLSTVGVQSASVDFASGKATVTYDEAVTNPNSLEKVIEALGFDVVYSLGRG